MTRHPPADGHVHARSTAAPDAAEIQRHVFAAMDAMLDPVAIAQPDGETDASGDPHDFVIVHVNDAARRWGSTVGTSVGARQHREPASALLRRYQQVYATGTPLSVDAYELEPGPGRERYNYVDLRVVRLRDELVITWRDVTDRVLAERELATSEARFRESLEGLHDPVLIADAVTDPAGTVTDLVIVYGNGRAGGITPPGSSLRRAVLAAGAPQLWDAYLSVLATGDAYLADAVPLPSAQADPWPRHVDVRARRLGPGTLLTSWRDATARVHWAAELAAHQERFRLAFDEAPIAIAVTIAAGPDLGRFAMVNQGALDLTGYSREELLGKRFQDLTHPDDVAADVAQVQDLAAGRSARLQRDKRLLRADGRTVWVRRTIAAVRDDTDRPRFMIAHMEDVTDRHAEAEELAYRALHDQLTGLPNRGSFLDALGGRLRELERSPGALAVLFLDLDKFKDVNDSLGHEAGDAVLVEVARRVAGCVRAPDVAARLAGDEFVVAARTTEPGGAAKVAERLVEAVGRPMQVAGRQLQIQPSVGVATCTASLAREEDAPGGARSRPEGPARRRIEFSGPRDADQLLRQADLAMYQAKRQGRRPWALYDEALHRQSVERLDVEETLRAALTHDWLRLLYQPIVDVADGRIVSAEALLRLAHPTRGLLPPAAFIDVAEDSSLIVPIGRWVLQEACRQLRRWQRLRPGMQVAVNVSARQARHLAVSEHALAAVDAAGVAASDVQLEITERTLIDAEDAVRGDLLRATDAGCRLAIDDFGTGYSSLTYLKRLPFSVLKVDRSFVAGVAERGDDRAIVEAVLGLSRTLDLSTVAEGVETGEQLEALRGLGCDRAQGFLIGHPTTGDDVAALLGTG